MKTTLMLATPATGLSGYVLATHSAHTAPNLAAQGTGLPFAGSSAATSGAAAQVAVIGARVTDLPGSVPRGAPV